LLQFARGMPCRCQRNRNGWNIGDFNPAAFQGRLENSIASRKSSFLLFKQSFTHDVALAFPPRP
jgi:hypothetical protein